jgi:hypothetical protein
LLGKKKEDIEQGGAGNAPLTTEWRRGGQPGVVKKRCSRWFAARIAEADRTAIGAYELWLQQQPRLMEALHELGVLDLVCWCAPLIGLVRTPTT